jgi:hypothetical protein
MMTDFVYHFTDTARLPWSGRVTTASAVILLPAYFRPPEPAPKPQFFRRRRSR